MKSFKCYKVYVTDSQGQEELIHVPVTLISSYLESAVHDSRVLITDIVTVRAYEKEKSKSD